MVVLKNLKKIFTAAKTRFGSGWAWLCKKEDGSLDVCLTPKSRQSVDAKYWLWKYSNFKD